jgi:GNAT superfamily N-acetyltransferase
MIREQALTASRDVVASWVAGWALSREVGPPTPAYGGLRVDVGLPDQKARYVFAEASPGVGEASRAIQEPNVFLKVCAPPELVQPLLGPGWHIKPISFMMTTTNLEPAETPLSADYHLEDRQVMAGHVANILTDDGDLAASGRVFLVGETAVFDRIETHPAHRRRGLGRTVMNELGRLARQTGASMGALVATADGHALYSAMGWRLHALYTTAVRE